MNKQQRLGVCRLCWNTSSLCHSHIIPKFAFKQSGLIGEKKKFAVRCVTDPSRTELHKQDGFKEYLLCSSCEGKLSKWETYAKDAFFHPTSPAINQIGEHCILGNLEYKTLKLFSTSVIWRMGISTLDYFSMVQLGAAHEEAMRQMLLTENPREPWRYGCMISALTHAGKPVGGMFSQPKPFYSGGSKRCYRFLFSGTLWNLFVSKSVPDRLQRLAVLQENGDWVLFSGEFTEHPDLAEERQILINNPITP